MVDLCIECGADRNLDNDIVCPICGYDPEKARMKVLLKASYDILKQCHNSLYVLDVMYVTAQYDDTKCDGFCLANDIVDVLKLNECYMITL